MKTILVTGRIGSGKSEVCRYLQEKGWPVFDCDSEVKKLYGSVPGLKGRIESELGIKFSELAVIFTDDGLRERLESIVFPLLTGRIDSWRDSLDSPLAFIESATAADRPAFDGIYDEVLLITAPLSVRTSRNPAAAVRDSLQNCPEDKATHIIVNDTTITELHNKIDKLYENRSC